MYSELLQGLWLVEQLGGRAKGEKTSDFPRNISLKYRSMTKL